MDLNLNITFATPWHMDNNQFYTGGKAVTMKSNTISIIYNSHKLSTQNTYEAVPYYSLKKPNIAIDMQCCWINSISMTKLWNAFNIGQPTRDRTIITNSMSYQVPSLQVIV